MQNKTSSEEWAQKFLKDHMSGEQLFEMYVKWCEENETEPVKHTVFFLHLLKHFGAL